MLIAVDQLNPLQKRGTPVGKFHKSSFRSEFDGSSSAASRRQDSQSRAEERRNVPYGQLVLHCLQMLQGIESSTMKVDAVNGLQFSSSITIPSFVQTLLRNLSWYAVKYKRLCAFSEEVTYGNWHGAYTRSLESAVREEVDTYLSLMMDIECKCKGRSATLNEEDTLKEVGIHLEEIVLMLWPTRCTFDALSTLVDLSYVEASSLISQAYIMSHTRVPEVKKVVERSLHSMCAVLKKHIIDWMFLGKISPNREEFFVQKNFNTGSTIPWNEAYIVDEELLPCFFSYQLANKVLLAGKSVIYVRNICSDCRDIPPFDRQRRLMEDLSPAHLFDLTAAGAFASCVMEACLRISTVVLDVLNSTVNFRFFIDVIVNTVLLRRGDFFLSFIEAARGELNKVLSDASILRLQSFLKAALLECYHNEAAVRISKWLNVELPNFRDGRRACDGVAIVYNVPRAISTA
uniref:Gamma-tubulin complex component n=1 Tax=Trichuris muris TaxID=70415 RepID=A0A5S6Q4G0_TRIMR